MDRCSMRGSKHMKGIHQNILLKLKYYYIEKYEKYKNIKWS